MKNKKLNVTIKVLETVDFKYSGYYSLHWQESEGAGLTVEEVVYFVWFFLVVEFFEWIIVWLFHALAILF